MLKSFQMRVTIGQINTTNGDYEGNTTRILQAIAQAKKSGATYADIRINRYRNESIFTREQQVQNVRRSENFGFGVRVLVKGAWGFSSSRVVTPEEVRRVTAEATETARANAEYLKKLLWVAEKLIRVSVIFDAAGKSLRLVKPRL